MTQVVEHLPRKREALNSNSGMVQNKKEWLKIIKDLANAKANNLNKVSIIAKCLNKIQFTPLPKKKKV
jgi:hypothetical protein